MAQADYEGEHRRARLVQLEAQPWCEDCGEPATIADHCPPLSRHEHVPGSGCCFYRSQCARCSARQAGELGGETTRLKYAAAREVVEFIEPDPIPADDPRWRVSWLVDLLDVPENATWPRFATLPHPDAVGSYGVDLEARSLTDHGVTLRWWTRLVTRLLLQHRADGSLIFGWAVVSTARQSGKTWWLRELAWWRMHSETLFGDEQQMVVHAARSLTPAQDAILPVLLNLIDSPIYTVTRAQSRFGVFLGWSGWRVVAVNNAYGQSAACFLIDEAWGVKPSGITEGIEPTIVERASGQLVLTSTAHRRASALMPERRVEAIEQIETPGRGLIVEWSMPAHLDIADRAGWRMASPHWSTAREELMSDALARAERGESIDPEEPDPIEAFRAQWLNQWPRRSAMAGKGEPLVDHERWLSLEVDVPRTPSGAAVIAIEDYHGNGYGAALVGEIDDGRLLIRTWTFERRHELTDWLSSVVALPTVIAGASLATDRDLLRVTPSVVRHGSTETGMALPLLRELVAADRIRHVGSPALAAQIQALRVRSSTSGLLVASHARDDLVRCAAWGARYVDQGMADPGGIS